MEAKTKAQVVYYLSRGTHMEHPHMMEVSHSPNVPLRLLDVKERMNSVRGKGLASSFSWSYKRNYNRDYIWCDVSDHDPLLPVRGNEYVLKGSEIIPSQQAFKQNFKQLQIPAHKPKSPANKSAPDVDRSTDNNSANEVCNLAEECGIRNIKEVKIQSKPESTAIARPSNDTQEEDELIVLAERRMETKRSKEKISNRSKSEKPKSCSGQKDLNPKPKKQGTSVLRQFLACGRIDTKMQTGVLPCQQSPRLRFNRDSEATALLGESKFGKSVDGFKPRYDQSIPADSSVGNVITYRHSFSNTRRLYDNIELPAMSENVKEVDAHRTWIKTSSARLSFESALKDECHIKHTTNDIVFLLGESKDSRNSGYRSSFSKESPAKNLVYSPRTSCGEESDSHMPSSTENAPRSGDGLPGRNKLDWEKNLQEAVNMIITPPEFKPVLQKCIICNGTFAADSAKLHARSCKAQRTRRPNHHHQQRM